VIAGGDRDGGWEGSLSGSMLLLVLLLELRWVVMPGACGTARRGGWPADGSVLGCDGGAIVLGRAGAAGGWLPARGGEPALLALGHVRCNEMDR